jgi:hypothetical protein
MWYGFDPQLRRDLETLRNLVALQHQTPKREWPLIYEEQRQMLFVVREWPDGSVTAYCIDKSEP